MNKPKTVLYSLEEASQIQKENLSRSIHYFPNFFLLIKSLKRRVLKIDHFIYLLLWKLKKDNLYFFSHYILKIWYSNSNSFLGNLIPYRWIIQIVIIGDIIINNIAIMEVWVLKCILILIFVISCDTNWIVVYLLLSISLKYLLSLRI